MTTAVIDLRNAEYGAISRTEPSYGVGSSDGGFYTGSGRSNSKKKKKGGLRARTAGAIISIALLLGGGAAFLSFSNFPLAPAISAQITSQTQTDYTSYIKRFKSIAEGMMDNAGATNPLTQKYSNFPNYMKERFAKYGIDVTGSGKDTRITWHDQTMDREGFAKMYQENIEFRSDVTKAKRGRVATFFDNIAENFFGKKLNSRNAYPNYKQTSDAEADMKNYKDTLRNHLAGDSTDLQTRSTKHVQETTYDSNGNPVTVDREYPLNSDSQSKIDADIDIEAAKTSTRSMIANIASSVGEVGSTACMALKVGSMIGMTAAALDTYNNIRYFLTQAENISKMMAGEGNSSAINDFLNFMSTPATTQVSDFDGVSFDFLNGERPADDENLLSQKEETGAPVEASGIQNMLAGAPIAKSSTQNYSIERVLKTMGGAMSMTAGTMQFCAGVDIATSIVSIATQFVSGGLTKILSNVLTKRTFMGVVTTVAVSAFFSFLIPTLAQIFFANTADLIGIPAGQAFASGAAATNMQEGRRGSGQSISSADTVQAFNKSTNQVLALEAELDRYNYSPFDTSNRNTFFGSIAYSLLPTLTSSNMTGISSFLRSVSTSLSSVIGSKASATNIDGYLSYIGDCPLLEEIGAVGDMYCNPIVTTDMSTIELSPNDEAYIKAIENDVECNSSLTSTNNSNSSSSVNGSDVTIIGDSITNGASTKLKEKLPGIDVIAKDSKFFSVDASGNPSGLSIIKSQNSSLRKNVIFALGTNQSNLTKNNIDEVITTIGSDHNIYFITNYKSTDSNAYTNNNQLFKQAASNHSNVYVIDWANAASADLIANDGLDVHPTSASQDLFVKLIVDALPNSGSNSSDSSSNIGSCHIKENSDLAKYIAFCDNRDSPFGAIDQNILGSLQSSYTNSVIINSIPIVGDFANIVNSTLDLTHLDWANGAKCVNPGNNTQHENYTFWQEQGKYYQRYIEDQRILEQMGAYEDDKNPVTAYIEEYEKEYEETHPEANTYIGYLSRISGLTPENTETVLAFVEYYTFVDQYDPTNRIAMDGDTSEPQTSYQVIANIEQGILRFDDSNSIDTPLYADPSKYIAYVDYSDLRNRSHAA